MYSNRTNHLSVHQPDPMADETENIYGIRLTPAVYYELIEYFNLNENLGLRQSDVIAKLLHAAKELSAIRSNQTASLSFARHQPLPPPPVFTIPKKKAIDIGNRPVINFDQDEESGEESNDEDNEEETFYDDEYLYEKEDDEPIGHGLTPATTATSITSRNIYPNMVTPVPSHVTDDYYSEAGKRLTATSKVKRNGKSKKAPKTSASSRSQQDKSIQKSFGTRNHKPWTSNLRRLLFDIILRRRRDDLLYCNECCCLLKIGCSQSGPRCNQILDHVCNHVGKPIMHSCRLCSHRTATKMAIRNHVKKIHQSVNDFDDLTDNYYEELSERIKRCFDYSDLDEVQMAEEPVPKKRRTRLCAKTFSTNSVVRQFIFQTIEKWQRNNNLYCRLCDRWIYLSIKQSWKQTEVILHHICSQHFNTLLYRCLICDEQTITRMKMERHFRSVHQKMMRGNSTDQINVYEEDLKNLTSQCFDWEEGTGPPQLMEENGISMRKTIREEMRDSCKPRDEKSFAIRQYIFQILKNWRSGNAIYCRHCNCWVRLDGIVPRPCNQTQAVLNHLCAYNNILRYRCFICDQRLSTSYQILRHIRKVHQMIGGGNFAEEIDGFETYLKETATKWFDWDEGTGPPELTADGPFLKNFRYIQIVEPAKQTRRGSCKYEAVKYGRELISQLPQDSRTIKCHLCDCTILIKALVPIQLRQAIALFDHAVIHIDDYAYECRICNETKKKRSNILRHITANHPNAGQYDFF